MRSTSLAILVLCAVACALVAGAQQPPVTRIGFLWTSSRETTSECIGAFHQGLREAGYVEGRDVFIEHRWAADVVQGLDPLAAELVRSSPASRALEET